MKAVKKRPPGRPVEVGESGAQARIGLRLTVEMRKRLEKWSKSQADKPGNSEAVRRLLTQALTAAGF